MEALDWTELQGRQGRIFDWLRDLGLDKHHRLNKHRENIREILEAQAGGRYEDFRSGLSREDQRERLWSICESIEFVDALHPLIQRPPDGVRRVLEQALQGPVDLSEETEKTNRGRNATFELVVGGIFARSGFPVEFRDNPDVLTEYSGRPVVIQCKRPFKVTSVGANLFAAGKQVRKDLEIHCNAISIVAISFSRLFNSGNQIAVFSTEAEMETSLHRNLRSAGDGLGGTLAQIKRYGISGTLFHTGTPAFLSMLHQMTFRQVGVMIPVAASKAEGFVLQEIAKRVRV